LNRVKNIYFYIILLNIIFYGCKPTALIKESEYLLQKNKININKKGLNKDEIKGYIKQQPNRKIIGFFKFHLNVYNLGCKSFPEDIELKLKNTPIIKKYVDNILKFDSIYKYNLRTIIGEPPVILDTNLAIATSKQIQLYLQNKGYFNSDIKVKFNLKNKKAQVTYIINVTSPYYIENVAYLSTDPIIKSLLLGSQSNSHLKKGNIYDVDNFEAERNRITSMLKNEGYYLFSKEYITFKIDTNNLNKKMNVEVLIKNPSVKAIENKDSIIFLPHKRFKINKIWIYPNYSLLTKKINLDTTIVETMRKRKSNVKRTYYFVHEKGKINIKPQIITQSIFINSDDYFQLDKVNLTYNRLSELRNFGRINITFEDVSQNNEYLLDCKILLPPTLRQSVSIETEGTNTGGNLGIGGVMLYENRNIGGGAEIFNFKIKGQVAAQKVINQTKDQQNISTVFPFNTLEIGSEAKVFLPRFLLPVKPEQFSKFFKPKTTILSGYNYQKRPDYTRYIANAAFGYEWNESAIKKHIFYPFELNVVKIYPSEEFAKKIDSIQNIKIKNTYRDHLITTGRWNFIINTQSINKTKNFAYFKVSFETAGLVLRLGNIIFNSAKINESFSILGIKYTQFIKTDIDYRYYNQIGNNNWLASRVFFGIGIPYGNVNVLPFEKSFYVGGSNSIRAWKLKTLGPGSFSDSLNTNPFERIGDIAFETNLEYRFPLYSFLNGALFIDAGNIWLKNKNKDFQNGNFEFKRALSEIAIGTGIGARLNFNFFIVRLDAGIPVKDPAKPLGKRFVIKDLKSQQIVFNFGIGYPF